MPFIGPKIVACLLGAITMTGCDDFPKDIAGTMDGVVTSRTMRAGIVAGGSEDEERAVANRIASALNVSPEVISGSTEELVRKLDEGKIAIVVGEFAKVTPWVERAAITGPARASDPSKDQPVLRALVRSGENRWLIFVSRALKEPRG